MNRGINGKKAFTLVEVMVASVIFGMVIAGGFAGVKMGFEIVDNSQHYTRVSQILQTQVESLRSLSWIELIELDDNEEIDISSQFSPEYYNNYTVRRRIYVESATMRRVEIAVAYETQGGRPISLKYITFFTEGGVNDYFYRTI